MKRMCNMRMREYCCCDMMAMTMKEGIYIVGINKVKKKQDRLWPNRGQRNRTTPAGQATGR